MTMNIDNNIKISRYVPEGVHTQLTYYAERQKDIKLFLRGCSNNIKANPLANTR